MYDKLYNRTKREDFGTKRSDYLFFSFIAYFVMLVLNYLIIAIIFGDKKVKDLPFSEMLIFFCLVAVYELILIPLLIRSAKKTLKKKRENQLKTFREAETK